jgi:hypothetical protein
VLDLVREVRPPFSPEAVVEQFAELLRAYGIAEVAGDRYGGEWPAERFRKAGIAYRISEATKSEIYGAFLPVVTSGRVELLDDERLLRQLQRLERRTARGGRDSIDHPPGSHDDLANACAGALGLLGRVGGGANLIEYYRRLNEKLRHEEAAAAQPVPVLGPHVPTVGELAAEAAARSDPQPGVVVPATTAEPVKRSSNFAEAAVLQGRSGEPEPMRPRALPSTYRDGNSVVTRYGSPDGGDGKRRRRVAGFSGERS